MKSPQNDDSEFDFLRLVVGLLGVIFFGAGFYRLLQALHNMDLITWFTTGIAMAFGGLLLCQAIKWK